jgi:pimeloyl-CoA synthetase
MKAIMPSIEELATTRYQLMQKGYLNQTEVMKFVPCGYKKAKEVITKIRDDITAEGIENLDKNIILASRLIKYLGLSEKKIKEAYAETKKATDT